VDWRRSQRRRVAKTGEFLHTGSTP
jgi:hypothetical protein